MNNKKEQEILLAVLLFTDHRMVSKVKKLNLTKMS